MPRFLLTFLLFVIGLSSLKAQFAPLFYAVDTVGYKNSCSLPMLYFEDDRTAMDPIAAEDLFYVASLLEAHPDMKLRLRTDGLYRRFDNRQRRLNRARVNKIVRRLKKEYDIKKSRIIKIYHQPWQYRGARAAEPPALVYRRVVCECVWD